MFYAKEYSGNYLLVCCIVFQLGQVDIVDQLDENRVELARIPLMPLVIDKVVNATYSITKASDRESEAYLIQEKSPSATFETGVTAIKYDARYYQNDSDFTNSLIA